MRQLFQVLVIPFIRKETHVQFAVFLRTDMAVWQFISGGGEDAESPQDAALRESREELSLKNNFQIYQLDSLAHIPSFHFSFNKPYVIPEYCFAIDLTLFSHKIKLSSEHKAIQWLSYQAANEILEWDSNKTALYELNERLKHEDML
ncbi:NUDIX hydrolase [Listeria ivanovii]|uniref:Nudix hydrolase domain-containing protein n=1 Tax=Listeria ivanovii (strain ATCC BAA-678 / PAM 55) TaxID=881621 RepID=G2Z957_LISIP|nr:NUDIX pyrophosphatase [Listeria ivanovii]AHI57142.1 DNA mismatch repair protein MutT [Listeria ivanovii WSLC3009]AIS66566.1 DNA mismatch repair protein MutT [Listeria ivanovii subsp. ivanovii]MBC1759763.1 NUDIX pyrophosphatase [Listeria ivanovii]MCJ1717866.1 NUDIX pyrophosphatase [Listeria ivanovii]MCJ1723064.1 NUDIX pyrophosphatase [Listeria ivanovii]